MPLLTNNVAFIRTVMDSLTISSSSTFTSGSPATNVQHTRPKTFARSTDTSSGTPAFVTFDVGSGLTVAPSDLGACAMYLEHDGTLGTLKLRVRTSNNADISSPTYDSGTLSVESPRANRAYAHAFENPYDTNTSITASRYVRFDLWATSATFIDIGRLYFGDLFQPTVNVAYGSSTPAPREDPRRVPGALGQQISSAGRPYTATAGTLQFSTEAEEDTFSELVEYRGTNRDLVYIHDPKTASYLQQQLIYGRFDTLAPMNIPRMNFWAMRYSFSSVR